MSRFIQMCISSKTKNKTKQTFVPEIRQLCYRGRVPKLALLRSPEMCRDVASGLGLSGSGCRCLQTHRSVQKYKYRFPVHQSGNGSLVTERTKNLAKGCNSLSFSLLFAEKGFE